MSVYVLTWVFEHSPVALGPRLVLLSLADHAKHDGTYAWPSVETIANQARLSRRATQSALRKLEDEGHILKRGVSAAGTTIYDVVMGGADTAPGGCSPRPGGAQNPTGGGEAASPEPSVNRQGSVKTILSLEEEPAGFLEWLGHHVTIAAQLNLSMSVPHHGTRYRSSLARTFAALAGEGYGLEEFKLASEGVLSDDYMRAHGHVKPENVLRVEKIGGRVENGRLWRQKRATTTDTTEKYGHLDG